MSITPNLMNNDCTSLDGWDVTDVDVSGGGFHFPRYSDIYMVGPLIPYAGNTATIDMPATDITTNGGNVTTAPDGTLIELID